MPESPRWLVVKGRFQDALDVLILISNSKHKAETKLHNIKLVVPDNTQPQTEYSLWKELLIKPTPALCRIMLVAIAIHFSKHAAGIEVVILCSPRIFKAAGIASKSKLLLATVGVGVTKTLFILVAMFFLDKVGRRTLLLTSIGATAALATLGLGLTVVEHSKEKVSWALGLSIAATYIYMAFFSIGLAPITWVYTSEIFPLKFRGIGSGLGVAVNRTMNAAVSMSFISIYKAITIGGAFFMFAGFAALAFVFFYFLLPETKGKSLEEIEMMFTATDQEFSSKH